MFLIIFFIDWSFSIIRICWSKCYSKNSLSIIDFNRLFPWVLLHLSEIINGKSNDCENCQLLKQERWPFVSITTPDITKRITRKIVAIIIRERTNDFRLTIILYIYRFSDDDDENYISCLNFVIILSIWIKKNASQYFSHTIQFMSSKWKIKTIFIIY